MQSESIAALAKALIEVQAALPKVTKDKVNPFFHNKYVGLDTVMPLALEVLNEHGFALVQPLGNGSAAGSLDTILIHESGEWISGSQPLLLAKDDPQGQGSAITYARRYGLMAMLGLVAEDDDDGNAASPPRDARPPAQQYAEDRAPQQRAFDSPKQMQSKFPGKCYACGGAIGVGDDIWYDGGIKKPYHLECWEPAP